MKVKIVSIEPLWLQIARNEMGVKETPGKIHNKRILEYHQATTLKASADEIAWCAAFVCWCLEMSGQKSTRSAAARSYIKYGKAVKDFPVGAIVVLQRGEAIWQGHVGFIVGSDKDSILVLGGNQGQEVCLKRFPKSRVLGVRWPISA